MSARVLIHGADNFIGQRLRAALLGGEWAEPVAVASGDQRALRAQIGTADALVHCVAGGAAAIGRHAAVFYAALASVARQPRVVHLSSMTVYGSANGTVDETSPLRADLGAYARSQLTAEALARGHADSVILRPGAEYGPTCPYWSGRIARLLRAHRLGDLGAAGDGTCNLVYIDDLVAVITAALRAPDIAGEAFNVAAAEKPTWNDYFVQYALALGAVPVRRIGARRLRIESQLLAAPLKLAELAAGAAGVRHLAAPPVPSSLLRLCRQEISLAVGKAERLLGAHWTPLGEGLRAAAAYFP
jgi:nucleoside-diphosphate-sugar epimerase